MGETAENGSIQKIHISDGGGAYTDIPTLSITTTSGTGAKIVGVTDDIGAITEVNVQDSGFAYSVSNPPEMTPQGSLCFKRCYWNFHKWKHTNNSCWNSKRF